MKVSWGALGLVAFIPLCVAQSGGEGGGAAGAGGIVGGLILSPCCFCLVCYLCIRARRTAMQEKEDFLDELLPASCPTEICIGPQDGTYVGSFKQGHWNYDMQVHLQFQEKSSLEEGKIRFFKVSGQGYDEMGKFKLAKGECKLGKTGRIFFRKKYISIKFPYSTESIFPLIYKGDLASHDLGEITGEWKFVQVKSSDRFPHVCGTFRLKLESRLSDHEATIELPVEPPSLNLEKTPLLQRS